MNYNKIACFDMEMCCWEGASEIGEIIEIGVAELNVVTGDITKSQYFVKPQKDEISDFCTKLTGITSKQVNRQGRPLVDVLETISRKHGSANKIYACWGKDKEYLENECRKIGIESPVKHCLDMSLYFGLVHQSARRPGQSDIMKLNGVEENGKKHSGVDDAYNLARLAQKVFVKNLK